MAVDFKATGAFRAALKKRGRRRGCRTTLTLRHVIRAVDHARMVSNAGRESES